MPEDSFEPTGASRYGRHYWCVGLADDKATEVYAHADRVEFTADGGVSLQHDQDDGFNGPVLAFAPGRWQFVYAASVMDGHAVPVAHWPGQIAESGR